MKKLVQRTIITLIICSLLLLNSYLLIFGRALQQKDNHFKILVKLPEVALHSNHVARIDTTTYLAKNPNDFLNLMKAQGFTPLEQMGAAFLFEKDHIRHISSSHMYSSHYMIFTHPIVY